MPTAKALLIGRRTGDRRPDAEFRIALGLGLISFGFGLSLVRGDS